MIDEFLIQKIGDELARDTSIDIEGDTSSMGKVLYKDIALEHGSDDTTYVELYAEIPRIKLEFWGSRFGLDSSIIFDNTFRIVKNNIKELVSYVFSRNARFENLQPVELDEEGLHQEFKKEIDKYIIQINLTAKSKAKSII